MSNVTKTALNAAARRVAESLVQAGTTLDPLPVVGLREIGLMFGFAENTPYQWRSKGKMPVEDRMISGNPFWKLPTIYAWAEETNRLIRWDPWGVVAPAEPVPAPKAA